MTVGDFSSSPFSILADRRTAACWAGRASTKAHLERLVRSWALNSNSSLDLVWANFGAGKTHTLYHLNHLLATSIDPPIESVPIVVELPDGTGKFIDFFRILSAQLPWTNLAPVLLGTEAVKQHHALAVALRALTYGEFDAQQLARQWLGGHRPHLSQLKSLGIAEKIESDDAALGLLRATILGLSQCDRRLVLLIDEFQRVGLSRRGAKATLLPYLRAMFSQCPSHFSVVLAIKSRLEDTALKLLPDELRTLLGLRPAIQLAPFERKDVMEFVLQRLDFFRLPGKEGQGVAPFTTGAVEEVLDWLEEKEGDGFGPREVLQALGMAYEHATMGGLSSINQQVVQEALGPA